MAKDKKSFVAYADWSGMFKALPDDVAGKLIKHIFSYVNDENPKSDDYIINALFEQIKATLKRDLKKWERQREQRSEAGKKSAEVRASKLNERSTSVNENERNSTVSVSDSVTVSDINKNKHTPSAFSFYNSLLDLGAEKQFVSEWIKVRKTKKLTQTETALKRFITEVEKSGYQINEILQKCIEQSWGGFKSEWHQKSSLKTNQPINEYDENGKFKRSIGKTNQPIMVYKDAYSNEKDEERWQ